MSEYTVTTLGQIRRDNLCIEAGEKVTLVRMVHDGENEYRYPTYEIRTANGQTAEVYGGILSWR